MEALTTTFYFDKDTRPKVQLDFAENVEHLAQIIDIDILSAHCKVSIVYGVYGGDNPNHEKIRWWIQQMECDMPKPSNWFRRTKTLFPCLYEFAALSLTNVEANGLHSKFPRELKQSKGLLDLIAEIRSGGQDIELLVMWKKGSPAPEIDRFVSRLGRINGSLAAKIKQQERLKESQRLEEERRKSYDKNSRAHSLAQARIRNEERARSAAEASESAAKRVREAEEAELAAKKRKLEEDDTAAVKKQESDERKEKGRQEVEAASNLWNDMKGLQIDFQAEDVDLDEALAQAVKARMLLDGFEKAILSAKKLKSQEE